MDTAPGQRENIFRCVEPYIGSPQPYSYNTPETLCTRRTAVQSFI